ncbi:GNAT family N-acetyltransferase [Legionella oakridgensis]|uniref:GNAT family N-acetyltransferase n=1 Tax=Legionella oakridgensis TaxID=29423 RepID=UPI0003DE66D6|nr:GNAT family N-acetyltransferase [Legionella oakridgensis]ETO94524.1 acetyltransferase, including N-acetylase of ribosomal protein [Legionella oakridgensis RV-2-2007]
MNPAIVNYIRDLYLPVNTNDCENIHLRLFRMEDADLIYTWRNHLSVRQQSLNDQNISFSEHYAWCKRKANDAACIFLIAMHNEKPIGTIRYEVMQKTVTINIYLDPDCQGQGYGGRILSQSILFMQSLNLADKIKAQVKETNIASRKMFERCGFIQI